MQFQLLKTLLNNGLNITEAAKQHYVVQSAVSRQLSLLEDELGMPLFERKGKRLIAPTPLCVDIAKEVVDAELKENSTKVAFGLSKELIKELQNASKITLKVNPKNHGEISKRVGSLKHVEVISDGAVSEGGVIALSDVGNIDAQISKRFQRVKRAALSE